MSVPIGKCGCPAFTLHFVLCTSHLALNLSNPIRHSRSTDQHKASANKAARRFSPPCGWVARPESSKGMDLARECTFPNRAFRKASGHSTPVGSGVAALTSSVTDSEPPPSGPRLIDSHQIEPNEIVIVWWPHTNQPRRRATNISSVASQRNSCQSPVRGCPKSRFACNLSEALAVGATVTAWRGRVFATTAARPRQAVTVAP